MPHPASREPFDLANNRLAYIRRRPARLAFSACSTVTRTQIVTITGRRFPYFRADRKGTQDPEGRSRRERTSSRRNTPRHFQEFYATRSARLGSRLHWTPVLGAERVLFATNAFRHGGCIKYVEVALGP